MTLRSFTSRHPLALILAASLLFLLPLTACGGDEPESVMETREDAPAGQEAAPGGGSPIGPISSRSGSAAQPPAVQRPAAQSGPAGAAASSIRWRWPESWQQETPSSAMRLAQASIPGEAGDASLAVFHFGPGGGGSVEDNLARWVGQMEVEGEPDRQEFPVGDYQVTWVDVAGTLLPSTMGAGPSTPQPDSRLLGAIVEGPGGPWFFKATGPAPTLAAARDEFRGLLQSLEPAG